MKPRRVFFHTLHIPLLRLLIPLAFFVIFSTTALSLLSHHQALVPLKTHALVMVDPGHGGYDPGVKSDGVQEKAITLAIGKKLVADLQARGIPAVLTREDDSDFADSGTRGGSSKRSDLDKRLEMAREQNAAIFISLHANVSSLATRGGAEVFYYAKTQGARELAERVQKELHELPEMSKRDAKPENYYLLRNQNIPALIVECGYLNISGEHERLINSSYQSKIARAIGTGVEQFLREQNQHSEEEKRP